MSKRGLGLVLVLTFVIAAATLVQDYRFDLSLARERAAADNVLRASSSVEMALANLRGAQAAYLAAGQSPDFWMKRASDLSAEIETSLASLQAAASAADARSHYDAAISASTVLNGVDQQARTDVANDERFLASDLVFMDAIDARR